MVVFRSDASDIESRRVSASIAGRDHAVLLRRVASLSLLSVVARDCLGGWGNQHSMQNRYP